MDSLQLSLSTDSNQGAAAEIAGSNYVAAADINSLQPSLKETSDTNGRVTATDPVNTAVPGLQPEFNQA